MSSLIDAVEQRASKEKRAPYPRIADITAEYLKARLSYDPNSGEFTWLATVQNSRIRPDRVAGICTDEGYIVIRLGGRAYRAHRLAWLYMTGGWPTKDMDHINHIRHDNRWSNLREVSCLENSRNMPIPSKNTSGVVGVYWHTKERIWYADIRIEGKKKHLGSFHDFDAAVTARKAAEVAYGFHPNHGSAKCQTK